jgi:hypothetical protein
MFLGNWNIDSSCEISLGYGFFVSRNMGLENHWKGSIRKTALEGQHWKGSIGRATLGRTALGRTALGRTALGRTALGRTALEGPHLEDLIGNPPSGKGALG